MKVYGIRGLHEFEISICWNRHAVFAGKVSFVMTEYLAPLLALFFLTATFLA